MPSYIEKVRTLASLSADGVVRIELAPPKRMPAGTPGRETLSIIDLKEYISVFVLSECSALGIEIDKKPGQQGSVGQLRNVLRAPGNCIQTVAPGEEDTVLRIVYDKIDLAYEQCIG